MGIEEEKQAELQLDVNAGIAQLEAGIGSNGDEVFARLEERAKRLLKLSALRDSAQSRTALEEQNVIAQGEAKRSPG